MIKIIKKRDGYAILELLFYIAFFSVLSLVVINAMITMARSFRETTIQAELVQSGTIIEKISREIRQAYGISSISATDLVLNAKDINRVNKTVEFLLSGTNVKLLENSVLTGNLNTPNITITALTFTQITTTQGKAVKVSLTLKANDDALNRNQDFYDTIVLRGNYQ
jgi:Tfp pilus assembly protein PilE